MRDAKTQYRTDAKTGKLRRDARAAEDAPERISSIPALDARKYSKLLVFALYSAAILGIGLFGWNGQNAARWGGNNALYRNLMEGQAWIRRGFDPANIQKIPEAGRDWYLFEKRPLRVRDAPLPGLPKRPFLSPWGREAEEFTIIIALELDAPALAFLENREGPAVIPGFFIACIGENWEIYLNGTLLRSEMRLDRDRKIRSSRTWRDVYFPADKHLFKEGANTLALRIIGDPSYGGAGLYYAAPFYLDTYEVIERRQQNLLIIAFCGVFGFIGFYHLTLFFSLRRNRECYNLYYGIFSFLLCCYFLARNGAVINRLIPDSDVSHRFEYAALFLMISLLGLFFESLGRRRITKITWLYTGFCLFLCLNLLIPRAQYHDDILKLWNVCTLLYLPYLVFYSVIAFYFSVRRKRRTAELSDAEAWAADAIGSIMTGVAAAYIAGVVDLLDVLFFHHSLTIFQYSGFVFHIGIAFTLSGRLNELYNRLEQANAALEAAVQKRTAALEVQAEKLEEQTAQAVAANQSKSRFLATMSHEIRTPMGAILGLSEITLRAVQGLPETARINIEKIHASCSGLLGIINDILDFSKIESGKFSVDPHEYDLPSLINDAAQLHRVRTGNKDIRFILEADADLPRRVWGDALRIKQILNNMLSNAFKYTEEGFVLMAVSRKIGEAEKDLTLVFKIADSGQGMKNEDVEKLFDDYSRFNTGANRATEGTGLGMSIAQKLALIMGGTIEVASEYGKGSVFTVSLPQENRGGGVIGETCARELKNFKFSAGPGKRTYPVQEYMPYGSVLVVDDLETNRYVAAGLLSPYGLALDTAGSGEEALEKVRSGKSYDVIFMDHLMPGKDGIATVAEIRDLGYTGTIIALTANAIAGQAEQFLQNGFDGFIAKPIDIMQLDAALRQWVKDKHPGAALKTAQSGGAVPGAAPVPPPASAVIPGLDTEPELPGTGGAEAFYRSALASFYRDTQIRLPLLAGGLEETDGDRSLLAACLPLFACRLAELAEAIRAVLNGGGAKPESLDQY